MISIDRLLFRSSISIDWISRVFFRGSQPPECKTRLNGSKPPPGTHTLSLLLNGQNRDAIVNRLMSRINRIQRLGRLCSVRLSQVNKSRVSVLESRGSNIGFVHPASHHPILFHPAIPPKKRFHPDPACLYLSTCNWCKRYWETSLKMDRKHFVLLSNKRKYTSNKNLKPAMKCRGWR